MGWLCDCGGVDGLWWVIMAVMIGSVMWLVHKLSSNHQMDNWNPPGHADASIGI